MTHRNDGSAGTPGAKDKTILEKIEELIGKKSEKQ